MFLDWLIHSLYLFLPVISHLIALPTPIFTFFIALLLNFPSAVTAIVIAYNIHHCLIHCLTIDFYQWRQWSISFCIQTNSHHSSLSPQWLHLIFTRDRQCFFFIPHTDKLTPFITVSSMTTSDLYHWKTVFFFILHTDKLAPFITVSSMTTSDFYQW